jgi:hypothetical protein
MGRRTVDLIVEYKRVSASRKSQSSIENSHKQHRAGKRTKRRVTAIMLPLPDTSLVKGDISVFTKKDERGINVARTSALDTRPKRTQDIQ